MKALEIVLEDISIVDLFGQDEEHLKFLKKMFNDLNITVRGNKIKAKGNEALLEDFAYKVETLRFHLQKYGELTEHMVVGLMMDDLKPKGIAGSGSEVIVKSKDGQDIKARTPNQKKLVMASEKSDLVMAIGPAGTGKTYTAVALAARALKKKLVKKIILTRPAVEAGESLGFLPGDLKEKVDPFLRPLYDALDDMFGPERTQRYIEDRVIEIAPLAFMRGRTLDKAFIILDEGQNATYAQLKMFLTRIGVSSRCIITGDLSQIDLPRKHQSGLNKCIHFLKQVEGVETVNLNNSDVIRHPLVARIINAFDEYEDKEEKQ